MDEGLSSEMARYADITDRLIKALENFPAVAPSVSSSSGNIRVTNDMGHWAVWITTTCAVAMLVGLMVASSFMSSGLSGEQSARLSAQQVQAQTDKQQNEQISRALDYVQALYRNDPKKESTK